MKLHLDAKSKLNENQFYGSEGLLNLFQQLPKVGTNPNKNTVFSYLNNAFKECDTYEKKQLFYSIVFSIGDISNRNHNLFITLNLKKVENGGVSLRIAFIYCLEWMLTFNKETENQFYGFLPIIGEFTNNKNIFFYELRTDRKKGDILNVIKLPINIEKVTDYIASVLKDARTTDVTRTLWAKFLPIPNFSKRKRTITVLEGRAKSVSKKLGYSVKDGDTFNKYSKIQQATNKKEVFEFNLVLSLSTKMDWEIKEFETNTQFTGLRRFKNTFLSNSESTLFSQKEILNFNKTQFIDWVNKLPAGARYRVQRRLFNIKDGKPVSTKKWINSNNEDLADWFTIWEKGKLAAQETLLSLTEDDKKEMSKEDFRKIEKAAKVNVAGETLIDAICKIKQGVITSDQAKLISQSIMNKIRSEVPVFMWIDVSTSMTTNYVTIEGVRFSAREISEIVATAFLMLNPKKELGNFFGVFSTTSNIVMDYNYSKKQHRGNQWLHADNVTVKDKLLIDHTKSFYENYLNIKQVLNGFEYASTNIESISNDLKRWVDSDIELKSQRIELIQQFPVHLYVSDGDFNNLSSPSASILKHRQNMKQWFNWDGLIVIWDVKQESKDDGKKFRGISNTMYFGNTNPGTLSQIFENLHDLDIIDDFAPLLAFFRTIRYSPVRELVIDKNKVNKAVEHGMSFIQ